MGQIPGLATSNLNEENPQTGGFRIKQQETFKQRHIPAKTAEEKSTQQDDGRANTTPSSNSPSSFFFLPSIRWDRLALYSDENKSVLLPGGGGKN